MATSINDELRQTWEDNHREDIYLPKAAILDLISKEEYNKLDDTHRKNRYVTTTS